MSYKVTVAFADSLDDGFVYRTGDTYPREGYEPTPDRIIELMGTANGRGFPVMEQVADAPAEPETEKEEIPFSEPPTAEEAEATAEEEEKQEEPVKEAPAEPKERKRTASKATKAPAKTGSRRKAK